MLGPIKEWLGKLTDDDLEKIGGKFEKLIGRIQEKYVYTKKLAEEEFNRLPREAKIKGD
jgi:uncharacterized protein YjbJ (UPF0337 family)